MAETPAILSSLYLPVIGKNLVLPNVTVAEIVDYQKPEAESGAPDWFLGNIQWRGVKLPVISYDRLNGETEAGMPTLRRLAVINTISESHAQLPFFGVVTQGIPRQVKIESEMIKEIESETGPADLMMVSILGEDATVPNLEYIERQILQRR
ncbi:MAG: chemotaxis protein CheW [Hahellaceae bacterium]|nr:chemotaxis protein CheW [Hahellaceae bacterium]MCP5169328.1 chemotaxis protein CheW [Hahellaceae bacterium]